MNLPPCAALHADASKDARVTHDLCEMTISDHVLDSVFSPITTVTEDVATNNGGWLTSDTIFIVRDTETSNGHRRSTQSTAASDNEPGTAVSSASVEDYSLSWKMCIDPQSYDYVTANGRYRERKEFVRKLDSTSRKRSHYQRSTVANSATTKIVENDALKIPTASSELSQSPEMETSPTEGPKSNEDCSMPVLMTKFPHLNWDRMMMLGDSGKTNNSNSTGNSRSPMISRVSSMGSLTNVRPTFSRSAGEDRNPSNLIGIELIPASQVKGLDFLVQSSIRHHHLQPEQSKEKILEDDRPQSRPVSATVVTLAENQQVNQENNCEMLTPNSTESVPVSSGTTTDHVASVNFRPRSRSSGTVDVVAPSTACYMSVFGRPAFLAELGPQILPVQINRKRSEYRRDHLALRPLIGSRSDSGSSIGGSSAELKKTSVKNRDRVGSSRDAAALRRATAYHRAEELFSIPISGKKLTASIIPNRIL